MPPTYSVVTIWKYALTTVFCIVTVFVNTLQGTLPADWGVMSTPSMSNLHNFSCSNCGLSGPLPSWGDATACNRIMEHFDVAGNAFTGAVPTAMEGWLNLQHFDVSGNQLTGVFSGATHCSLEALKKLRIARNNLTGPVPASELQKSAWRNGHRSVELTFAVDSSPTNSIPFSAICCGDSKAGSVCFVLIVQFCCKQLL
jgi:hypothetical protein